MRSNDAVKGGIGPISPPGKFRCTSPIPHFYYPFTIDAFPPLPLPASTAAQNESTGTNFMNWTSPSVNFPITYTKNLPLVTTLLVETQPNTCVPELLQSKYWPNAIGIMVYSLKLLDTKIDSFINIQNPSMFRHDIGVEFKIEFDTIIPSKQENVDMPNLSLCQHYTAIKFYIKFDTEV